MMKSNYIKKLLNGAKVEWKKLGEVAELKRGRVIPKTYLKDNAGKYPVYSSQTINNGEIGKINTYDFDGEFITWTTDGVNAGTVFYRKGKFSTTNICGLIKIINTKELNYKYLFYWLSIEAKKHVYPGMGNPKLMSNQAAKIPIPILPLSVQQEIVRILDAFTEITKELKVEIKDRQKQYEYYKDKLLTPIKNNGKWFLNGKEVEWKKLGEVCGFQNGFAFKSSLFKDTGLPIIRITNIDGKNVNLTNAKHFDLSDYNNNNIKNCTANKGDILIAMSGATTGKIGFYDYQYTSYINQRVGKFIPNEKILNNRYLYYYLLSKTEYIRMLSGGGAQQNLSSKNLMEKFQIPIPPLEEQERIVSILDKFNALTNSITEGLYREIELRKKQYDYYDKIINDLN